MSITVNLGGQEYVLRSFRDENHGFESFRGYINECVAPIMRELDEISTIRCSYSGVPTAITTINEIDDCIATGFRNLNLNRHDDLLGPIVTDEQVVADVEALVDDIAIRTILSWKKSASLTWSRDGAVIAAVAPQKQLAILMGLFLFLEDKRRDHAVEDEVSIRRRQAALADSIALGWQDEGPWQELLNLLIELDAKYRIVKISLNKKELEAIRMFNSSEFINPVTLGELVRKVIDWRDEFKPERFSDGTNTWTQHAWVRINAEMQRRQRYSNLMEEPKIVIGNKEYAVPKTPEAKEKLEKKTTRMNILKAIFGNLDPKGAM